MKSDRNGQIEQITNKKEGKNGKRKEREEERNKERKKGKRKKKREIKGKEKRKKEENSSNRRNAAIYTCGSKAVSCQESSPTER